MDQTTAPNFTAFYGKIPLASEKAADYLQRLKIPKETADALNLRLYDPDTMPGGRQALMEAIGSDPVQRPTLIIPVDEAYWVGIETELGTMVRPPKVDRSKSILGWKDLYTVDRPIWLAATVMDWLALKVAGANAVFLDTFGEIEFIRIMKEKPSFEAVICIPGDPQASTRGSCEGMAEKVRDAGIPATVPDVPEDWPGISGMLTEGIDGLRAYVGETEAAVIEGRTSENQRYDMRSAGALISRFQDWVYTTDSADAIPTGLEALDTLLDGGLYPGLYILGAMSSVGKTSLMLQIADTIAANDRDVLFFTAEQSANELMAKSLSRIMGETFGDIETDSMLTPREILRGAGQWSDRADKRKAFDDAVKRYAECAGHLWIIERDTDRALEEAREATKEGDAPRSGSKWRNAGTRIGLDTIDRTIRRHIELKGTRPVVFIDYLQILQPQDDAGKKSDKQVMDLTVSELRRMSKATEGGYNVPIIAISSLNRGAYYGPIGLDSYKESGSIEYSADVILALQPTGLRLGEGVSDQKANAQIFDKLDKDPKRILELKVLKNRMGKKGVTELRFNARSGRFYDCEIVEDRDEA